MRGLALLPLCGLVAAQGSNNPTCDKGTGQQPKLPDCTNTCLANKDTDGTCATNILGFCHLSGGTHAWFNTYGGCIVTACGAKGGDQEIYDVVNTFRNYCGDTPRNPFPKKVDNEISGYLLVASKYSSKTTIAASTMIGGVPTSAVSITSLASSTSTAASSSSKDAGPILSSAIPPSEEPTSTSTTQEPSTTQADNPPPDTSLPSAPTPSEREDDTPTTDQNPLPIPTTAAAPSNPSATVNASAAQTPTPALSRGAIAGTAAGSALAFFLVVSSIYMCLRRRQRSKPSSPEMWEPDRTLHHKAMLASAAGPQTPEPPPPQPPVPPPVGMRGGSGPRDRYYARAAQPELDDTSPPGANQPRAYIAYRPPSVALPRGVELPADAHARASRITPGHAGRANSPGTAMSSPVSELASPRSCEGAGGSPVSDAGFQRVSYVPQPVEVHGESAAEGGGGGAVRLPGQADTGPGR